MPRDEPFIVYSGDFLTDFDLAPLIDEHFARETTSRSPCAKPAWPQTCISQDGRVIDIGNRLRPRRELRFRECFGLERRVFSRAFRQARKSPSFQFWPNGSAKAARSVASFSKEGNWFNIGSRAEYLEVHRTISEESWRPDYVRRSDWPHPDRARRESRSQRAALAASHSIGRGLPGRRRRDPRRHNSLAAAHKSLPAVTSETCIVRSHRKAEGDTDVTPTSRCRKTDLLLRRPGFISRASKKRQSRSRRSRKADRTGSFIGSVARPEQTIILVKYNLEREENRHYVEIAEFLAAHQIRAPKIYFHDPAEGLIWIEDLGRDAISGVIATKAGSCAARFTNQRSSESRNCIAFRRMMRSDPAEICRRSSTRRFIAGSSIYFFENCLGRHLRCRPKSCVSWRVAGASAKSRNGSASFPRVLVHRDFQSQNIIVRDGQAHLIDFQGMRPGLAEYDLASLLYDPMSASANGARRAASSSIAATAEASDPALRRKDSGFAPCSG